MTSADLKPPLALTPGLKIADPVAAYWVAQVTLRLRREICWCWHQRMGTADPATGQLPALLEPVSDSLDLARYDQVKRQFFASDLTARYLSEQLAAGPENPGANSVWSGISGRLGLDEAAQFVFALGLAAHLDAAMGPVFSACHNDASRPFPTLALAQRLWDEPRALAACADPGHPLFRYRLLCCSPDSPFPLWHRPLEMNRFIAAALLDHDCPLPLVMQSVEPSGQRRLDDAGELLVARLAWQPLDGMQVVPLVGPKGSAYADWAALLSQRLGQKLVCLVPSFVPDNAALAALAGLCWLRGLDVVLPNAGPLWQAWTDPKLGEQILAPIQSVPVRWFLPMTDPGLIKHLQLPVAPAFRVSGMTYEQRADVLRDRLGGRGVELEEAIGECARRFRLEEETLTDIAKTLVETQGRVTPEKLVAACRAEVMTELDHLAQPVEPRFTTAELVLPTTQARQIEEIITAMRALTTVHYRWGTAKAWNECGLSVLFHGPPGTGKTMSAEALAQALAMPMYRIDLSQVVNKYIGETEKNLKRIFDAAELSDCILFFDEADALFGKRTEVKDSHDRYANIEISYLLERMERFKGLAILATNRRNDLDEAFLRRLRYAVEFPLPGLAERERIWQQVFPATVDIAALDIPYLAKQFPLSGGHIRSIAFNACLQSAGVNTTRVIGMDSVLVAVKRELDKMGRSSSADLFGDYAPLIRSLTT